MHAIILLLALAIRPDCDLLGVENEAPARQKPTMAVQNFDVASAIARSVNQQNPQQAALANANVKQTVTVKQGGPLQRLFGGKKGKQ